MAATSPDLIADAVKRVRDEVPAFTNLKLVFSLELTAGGLTGPAKSELYRIELPGPEVTAGDAEDARLALSVPKAMFELLAKEGGLADWKDAFYYGHLKVAGDDRVRRLLGKAITAA
jgi:hypothetical protein